MVALTNPAVIWLVILGITAISFALERSGLGRRLSGPTVAISLGLICSTAGLTPSASPVYDQITSALMPIAIPLLLFTADLRSIARRTGRLLGVFAIGVFGAVVVGLAAYALVAVPGDAAALTGVMIATYIGGTMNFVTTSQALNIPPSIAAARWPPTIS